MWASARAERGSVTAEFAVALPALVLVFGLCCNALSALAVRASLGVSSFAAARSLARGEPVEQPGTLSREGELLCVEQSQRVGLFEVRARSCLLDERGAASVSVLGLSAALLGLLLAASLVLGAGLARLELALAADASALAAAGSAAGIRSAEPCASAREIAQRWRAELTDCACASDGSCRVWLRRDWLGLPLSGRARAGIAERNCGPGCVW